METDIFMELSMNDKLETVNKMLGNETQDHLKNVSEKIGMSYSAFTKIMRDNGNYQYNQTKRRYERLMSLEEYNEYRHLTINDKDSFNVALKFVDDHLDDIKKLLHVQQHQLTLSPEVYDPSSKTVNKSFQVNSTVYNRFTMLCANQHPHLRQKDLISQCLLDFLEKYEKTQSD